MDWQCILLIYLQHLLKAALPAVCWCEENNVQLVPSERIIDPLIKPDGTINNHEVKNAVESASIENFWA